MNRNTEYQDIEHAARIIYATYLHEADSQAYNKTQRYLTGKVVDGKITRMDRAIIMRDILESFADEEDALLRQEVLLD